MQVDLCKIIDRGFYQTVLVKVYIKKNFKIKTMNNIRKLTLNNKYIYTYQNNDNYTQLKC